MLRHQVGKNSILQYTVMVVVVAVTNAVHGLLQLHTLAEMFLLHLQHINERVEPVTILEVIVNIIYLSNLLFTKTTSNLQLHILQENQCLCLLVTSICWQQRRLRAGAQQLQQQQLLLLLTLHFTRVIAMLAHPISPLSLQDIHHLLWLLPPADYPLPNTPCLQLVSRYITNQNYTAALLLCM